MQCFVGCREVFSIGLMLAIFSPAAGQARTIGEAQRGAIVWLETHQHPDGSWGSGRLQAIATAEVLRALAAAKRGDTVVARRAVGWLRHRSHASVDSAARAMRALWAAGIDVRVETLGLLGLGFQDASGQLGWGPLPSPLSGAPPERDAYDTALVVGALQETGLASDPQVAPYVTAAVAFLEGRQQFAVSTQCSQVPGQPNVAGWSGDGVPVPADALAGEFHDLAVTAEILRGLGLLSANVVLARNALTATCFPVAPTTPTLEIAARIVGWRATGGGSAPALESALLDDARFTATEVWSDGDPASGEDLGNDALVNAMGLLAIQSVLGPGWTLDPAGDEDGDGTPNGSDAFPYDPAEQTDTDGDGVGDVADHDKDGDGVLDAAWGGADVFPDDPTRAWDVDGDGTADTAQLRTNGDADGDGIGDFAEIAAGTDPFDSDTDHDGTPDGADACPRIAYAVDLDGDGVCTPLDECDDPQLYPDAALLVQSVGGRCDATDADGDGFADDLEVALGSDPRDASSTPAAAPLANPSGDFDEDGITNGDEALRGLSPMLADTDGDGVPDPEDDLLADAADPYAAPRGAVAVFSAAGGAPVAANAVASTTLGQPTPVATSGGDGSPPEAGGIRDAVGFQPQTLLGRDADGDGLAGWQETLVGASHRATDSDGDGFADGSGGVVPVTGAGTEWDLDNDGFVDGEADVGTSPADAGARPGRPGDVAPAGHPDGRITAGDAVLMLRLATDSDAVLDAIEAAGPNPVQNRAITEQAADASEPPDGAIRADDALHVLREAGEDTP